MTSHDEDDEDKYQTTQPIVDGRKTSGFLPSGSRSVSRKRGRMGLGDEKVMTLISL